MKNMLNPIYCLFGLVWGVIFLIGSYYFRTSIWNFSCNSWSNDLIYWSFQWNFLLLLCAFADDTAWAIPGLHTHHHSQWLQWKHSLVSRWERKPHLPINPSTPFAPLNTQFHFKLNNHFYTGFCDDVMIA